jgi:hypothetical protein
MIERRKFLSFLLAACLALSGAPALADDGGGSDGGGSGSGGGGGSDGGNSGSGSDNSGHGNGDDDSDDDDDNGGSSSSSQSRAREAVKAGNAASLRRILAQVKRDYPGEVVSVKLRGRDQNLTYAIKIVDTSNRLITLRVNARTGVIVRY